MNQLFKDGEIVNLKTLREKGLCSTRVPKADLKILAQGELKKKVTIEAHAFSKGAIEKLEKAKISFKDSRKARIPKYMIEAIRRIFAIPELKAKIIFTCMLLMVCRIGAYIPVPGINGE